MNKTDRSRRTFLSSCGAAVLYSAQAGKMFAAMGPSSTEKHGPARAVFPLDRDWLFGGRVKSDGVENGSDDLAFSPITLPHCVTPLSWQNWDAASWEGIFSYRRRFSTPEAFENRRVFLKFDGVMVTANASLNGTALPAHKGGYLPFTYEITTLLSKGGNLLDVKVDSRFQNVPPEGSPRGVHAVDYFVPGGIIRGASLYAVPRVFIRDVFAKPVDVLRPSRRVEIQCTVDAAIVPQGPVRVEAKLRYGARVVSTVRKSVAITAPGKVDVALSLACGSDIKLWDVDHPHLYELVTTLVVAGEPIHDHSCRIGFREAKFMVDGFFLNGRRLRLFGLNRHEIYPYVGYGMPPRVMRRDADDHPQRVSLQHCSLLSLPAIGGVS